MLPQRVLRTAAPPRDRHSATYADALLFHNPEPTGQRLALQERHDWREQAHYRRFILVLWTKHDQSRIVRRWICTDIAETFVQGDQRSPFDSDNLGKPMVWRSGERFLVDGLGVVARTPQGVGDLHWKILIDFEAHDGSGDRTPGGRPSYAGIASTRSLARSAA